ncbi:MAG: ParB/RepB/Spo0J family partition protein [Clostridiales bacterium]|nr:ParB/RepB/Spo0J family partition protein [Clostridiales bacterium]
MVTIFGKEKQINKVISININEILPNPNQPRTEFNEQELQQLSDSIRINGLLQPLTVRKNIYNKYELISGERRLRASKLAGLTEIPAIVVDTDERQSAIFALIENIQRADLNFFEEALAIKNLISEWNITQEEASERLGKAQSTLANKLRLLKLNDEEQQMILQNGLTERHARALLKINDEEKRSQALIHIIEKKMNVIQAETYIEQLLSAPKPEKKRILIIKDVRLFINTINKALDTMKRAGIQAETQKKQNDEFIEYVVRIPIKS